MRWLSQHLPIAFVVLVLLVVGGGMAIAELVPERQQARTSELRVLANDGTIRIVHDEKRKVTCYVGPGMQCFTDVYLKDAAHFADTSDTGTRQLW